MVLFAFGCLYLPHPPCPLSSRIHYTVFRNVYGWRGESGREGASPPLESSPPLEQRIMRETEINLFERGIKGVSIVNQPYANSIMKLTLVSTHIILTLFQGKIK
jgi:hypothetical protein